MALAHDAVVIGGGHNGLIAAFYLAKAGFKPLVLERRERVGGVAATGEFHPGFRVSTLLHTAGPISVSVLRDMQLERFGLRWITPEPRAISLSPPQRVQSVKPQALLLYGSAAQSAASIAQFSASDASRYGDVEGALARVASVLSGVLSEAPPALNDPGLTDLLAILPTIRGIRGLSKTDLYAFLRWAAMPVADLAAEWFETGSLQAAIAARALFGTRLGPMAPGTSLLLLLRAAAEAAGGADATIPGPALYPAGGMGALTAAMAKAAESAGAQIRTGAHVARILASDGAVAGVALSNGEEIRARAVISNADPRQTLLTLVGPEHFGPQLLGRVQNFNSQGSVAKMNLALDGAPEFLALRGQNLPAGALAGRILVDPSLLYHEKASDAAKYGRFSAAPVLEIVMPSMADSELAPAGKHVMSVLVQYAPREMRGTAWPECEQALGDTVVNTLAEYAPGLPQLIVGSQLLTPLDIERDFSLTGGHLFQGELTIQQLFSMRPWMEYSQYAMPLRGLFLCGSGTHPGVGLTGHSGANAARLAAKDLKKRR
ncbi:MAG: NAD(P)/FAD-dependent oxidoreductase [Acidobacteria bacterium]|nr:NAD(P)/FAD-dependent oxidoreductase [Acidobacteriota bacterium]